MRSFRYAAYTMVFCCVITGFSNHALSEDSYLQKWGDLPKFGLMPPGESDMVSAKRLIVLAIQSTSYKKGPWWQAHGLLGVTRLPNEPDEAMYTTCAYNSLFENALLGNAFTTALENKSQHGESLVFLTDDIRSKSFVYLRERYLGILGWELNQRFTFNTEGNYGSILTPCPNHKSTLKLKDVVKEAYQTYEDIKKKGFDDKTLGDAVGMVYALLDYDKISSPHLRTLPYADQIYIDAMNDIVRVMKETGEPFFDALERAMGLRKLCYQDIFTGGSGWDLILSTDNPQQLDALVKLIKEDLDNLEKVVSNRDNTSKNK